MDRVYSDNVSTIPPVIPFPGSYGFTQGSPELTQFAPTLPSAYWFYYVTESMRNVVVGAGLTPDPTNVNQFYQAVALIVTASRS